MRIVLVQLLATQLIAKELVRILSSVMVTLPAKIVILPVMYHRQQEHPHRNCYHRQRLFSITITHSLSGNKII